MVGDIVFGILMWGLVLLAMALASFVVWATAMIITIAQDKVRKLLRPSGNKLTNIPKQVVMTAEQEQVFTNGINKGRKLENKRVIKMLEAEIENLTDLVAGNLEDAPAWLIHKVEGIKASIALIKGDGKNK